MLRSNLCDNADSYILVKGTITITGAGVFAGERQADERDKGVTFRHCVALNIKSGQKTSNCNDFFYFYHLFRLIAFIDKKIHNKTKRLRSKN